MCRLFCRLNEYIIPSYVGDSVYCAVMKHCWRQQVSSVSGSGVTDYSSATTNFRFNNYCHNVQRNEKIVDFHIIFHVCMPKIIVFTVNSHE